MPSSSRMRLRSSFQKRLCCVHSNWSTLRCGRNEHSIPPPHRNCSTGSASGASCLFGKGLAATSLAMSAGVGRSKPGVLMDGVVEVEVEVEVEGADDGCDGGGVMRVLTSFPECRCDSLAPPKGRC